jgi:hypothetical protein
MYIVTHMGTQLTDRATAILLKTRVYTLTLHHSAREVLRAAPGVKVVDDIANNQYPMPLTATGAFDVEVSCATHGILCISAAQRRPLADLGFLSEY